MGHCITGLISHLEVLKAFSSAQGLHPPARLLDDLGFLPLSDTHLDILYPQPGESDSAMTYLSESLRQTLANLSKDHAVAYIETEYFGGIGTQSATVYARGQCIMPAMSDDFGPVSRALACLGVIKGSGDHDEFKTAGLDQYRNNDDWIDEAQRDVS